jgi:hypothetical protein
MEEEVCLSEVTVASVSEVTPSVAVVSEEVNLFMKVT